MTTTTYVVGVTQDSDLSRPPQNSLLTLAQLEALIDADANSFSADVSIIGGSDLIFVGTTGQSRIKMPDNLADALTIAEATNAYLTFVTTDSSETITVGVNLTMADAKNIVLNATTGTKIGTATTQKLAFYNSTPVVQPAASADVTGFVAGSGTASKSDSVWAGSSGSSAYTVGGIVTALKALGLLAS